MKQRRFIICVLLILMMTLYLMACVPATSGTKAKTQTPPEYANSQYLYDGINALSEKLINSTKSSAKGQRINKIAVADFIGPGDRITGLGEHIADKISVRLFSSGEFPEFVERKQLKQLLQAKKVEHGGYFDQQTVKKFGKLIGIDSMVIGTVEDLGTIVDVTAKIVETETGRIAGMADVRLIKDDLVIDLINKKRTATLTISVRPAVSGTVVAGGKKGYLQNGIATFTNMPYGNCQVIIQPDGDEFKQISKSINIRSSTEALSFGFETKRCDVSFQIFPPDAHLTINGKKIAVDTGGYANIPSLKAQESKYVVKGEGYKTKHDSFYPCQQGYVTVDLQAKDSFYDIKKKFFKKYHEVQSNQSFSIKLWTDKSKYKLDDPIHFYFRTEKDCYLILVNVGSSGNTTRIFPNQYHSDNFVRAGVEYKVPGDHYPFGFVIEPPAGSERVYALASTHPIDIFDANFRSTAYVARTRGNTRDIGVIDRIGSRLDQANLNAAAECIVYKKR